jgi:hypothetical protein|tara:strand:- start:221 stop:406 length:186 start_codon:yes stop_codon:yes gene_type:complete
MGKMNNEWLDLSQQWQEERYEQLMNYYNDEEIVMDIMADEVNEWNIEQAQKHGDWERPNED